MAELNKETECRRLRELFRGRFLQEEAEKLITHFKGLTDASNFVMQNEPKTVGEFLNRSSESYIELSREESESLNEKLTNGLELFSEERLFACQTCERSWWKKVPSRKQVSTCYKCKERYDPIPRDKEWGNGQFRCGHCQHEFNTPATMGMTISLCHRCNYQVKPYKVLPPRRKKEKSESGYSRGWYNSWGWYNSRGWGARQVCALRLPDEHNCNGINCHNCNHLPRPPSDLPGNVENGDISKKLGDKLELNARLGIRTDRREKPAVCIAPRSKPDMPSAVRVRTWSQVHASTGSTVTTCLDQGSLDTTTESLAYTMLTMSQD